MPEDFPFVVGVKEMDFQARPTAHNAESGFAPNSTGFLAFPRTMGAEKGLAYADDLIRNVVRMAIVHILLLRMMVRGMSRRSACRLASSFLREILLSMVARSRQR